MGRYSGSAGNDRGGNRITQTEIRAEIKKLEAEISDILMTDFMITGDNPVGFIEKMIDDRKAKIEELKKTVNLI